MYDTEFKYTKGKTFPIALAAYGRNVALFNLPGAEILLETLQAAVDEARENLVKYVQVVFQSGFNQTSALYTYIDPSGTLKVGDNVEVPTRYGSPIARVSALGRGQYTGPCKTVSAKLERKEL